MEKIHCIARTAPSSAFGTFSPGEKRGGERLSMKKDLDENDVPNSTQTAKMRARISGQ